MSLLKNKDDKWFVLLIFLLFLVDELSKQAILLLSNGVQGYSMRIFGEFLRFTYVENHGGIFGLFQGHIAIFTVLSTVLIIYVYMTELRDFSNFEIPKKLGISFLIAGAMGNMFDRLFRGYVIDMIDFRTIWSFIFNVADMYIHIGVYILIAYYLYCRYIKED